MCLALGAPSLDAVARDIDEMMTPKMPAGMLDAFKMLPMLDRLRDLMPKTVRDAPCQEVVKRDGSLDEFPILKTWPEDGGRYITLPLVFTKDPETGARNIGTYRMQVYDGRSTGMHWQRHKGGAQHHRVAERLGKRLEVAVALSPEPVLTYAATAPMPEGLDELLLAGFLRRERVELVKCVTNDLEVPASAQIVLAPGTYSGPAETLPFQLMGTQQLLCSYMGSLPAVLSGTGVYNTNAVTVVLQRMAGTFRIVMRRIRTRPRGSFKRTASDGGH
jgi:4-hydroxy-3-polyprenylbenzoate decarboxylase